VTPLAGDEVLDLGHAATHLFIVVKGHVSQLDGEEVVATIQEENPWTKVVDAVLGEVPVLGMFTGYFANPSYSLTRADGTVVMRLIKEPAMFEGKFRIEEVADIPENEETRNVLAMFMMLLLERTRG